MKQIRFGKKQKLLWGFCLAAAWFFVGLLLVRSHGGFTAQELVNYQPDSPLISSLIMIGLFGLKSVDFVMHSGVLYAANGIMFSLPVALLFNMAGVIIMITPSYFFGRAYGPAILQTLKEKYPKLRSFEKQSRGEIVLAVLMRSTGIPLHIASLYMGAKQFSYKHYMIGSLLGILPIMIPYTVMGESANDPASPVFKISIVVEIVVSLGSLAI